MTPSAFHSTRWTLVRRAKGHDEHSRAALSELCEIYYEPVLRFIAHRHPDQARDLTHGFFEQLLARENLGDPDPSYGKFRTYLLGSVKHFLSHQRERDAAAKRGGDTDRVPLDDVAEIGAAPEWERAFDRAWALALIGRALSSLEAEMDLAGKRPHFEQLRSWLDGGMQGDAAAAGLELGLSPAALKVAIHRLRQRFRQKVRDEIAATTSDPADAADEFRHLVEVWVKQEPTASPPAG